MSNKTSRDTVENKKIGRYVVLRNGARVSDSEYSSKDEARDEYDHWNKVITRWPDGSKLEIVEIKNR